MTAQMQIAQTVACQGSIGSPGAGTWTAEAEGRGLAGVEIGRVQQALSPLAIF